MLLQMSETVVVNNLNYPSKEKLLLLFSVKSKAYSVSAEIFLLQTGVSDLLCFLS